MVKCGETPLEGEGVSKKPVRAICMINVCDGPMETVMLNTCG